MRVKNRGSDGPLPPHALVFHKEAFVHDHAKSRLTGGLCGWFIHEAELHPNGLRTDRDCVVHDRTDQVRAQEDVDDVDRFGDRTKVGVNLLAKQLAIVVRMDRDDAVSLFLHVHGDIVARPIFSRRKDVDGDGLRFFDDLFKGFQAIPLRRTGIEQASSVYSGAFSVPGGTHVPLGRRKLLEVQARVRATRFEKLVVATLLDNLPIFDDEDQVRRQDGG